MYGYWIFLWVVLFIFWAWTFYSLMSMPDSAFKGRNDKLIWGVLMIVWNVVGALLFLGWRALQRTDDLVGNEVIDVLTSASDTDPPNTDAS